MIFLIMPNRMPRTNARSSVILLLALTAAGPPSQPPKAQISIAHQQIVKVSMPTIGDSTHLPLPRFASLKRSDVDLRVGPGYRYPKIWILRDRGLPVKIIREYDVWRQIETADGTQGWVKSGALSGKRDFLVTGAAADLYSTTDESSAVVARLEPGVIGHIDSCAIGSDWCKVETGNVEGWIMRGSMFGALPGETLP